MWSLRLCTNGITRTALPTSLPKGCAAGEQVFLLTPEMEETGGSGHQVLPPEEAG